jgi:transposase
MPGAKSKLTQVRARAILDAIRNGNTKENAAKMAGISEATIYNWLQRGREEEPPDLEGLPNKELHKLARHHQIKGYTKMNKQQLQDAITEASTRYAVFAADMERAEAEGIAYHVKNVTQAGQEDWKASAWYLERRDPANWAKRDRLQVDNNHSGSIKTENAQEYRIEVEHKLAQDPELQDLYIQIWERQQLANGNE